MYFYVNCIRVVFPARAKLTAKPRSHPEVLVLVTCRPCGARARPRSHPEGLVLVTCRPCGLGFCPVLVPCPIPSPLAAPQARGRHLKLQRSFLLRPSFSPRTRVHVQWLFRGLLAKSPARAEVSATQRTSWGAHVMLSSRRSLSPRSQSRNRLRHVAGPGGRHVTTLFAVCHAASFDISTSVKPSPVEMASRPSPHRPLMAPWPLLPL